MRRVSSLIAGKPVVGTRAHEVRAPYDGRVVTEASMGDRAMLNSAISVALSACEVMRRMRPFERAAILERFAELAAECREEFATMLCEEAGKPVGLGLQEADRCVATIRDAAYWAAHPVSELLPLDGVVHGTGRQGILKRFPIGAVAAITPFNFPLNLVAHKMAPAIAAGCPMVLKPASQTPSCAVRMAELAIAAGVPPEGINVVLASGADAELLVTDERIRMVTFTGSAEVGWGIKARCGKKKVALELGGNAGAIVERDADLPYAAQRVAMGGFAYAGQSCISVQRVFVQESVAPEFEAALVAAADAMIAGDPADPATMCGPLIDAANAARVEQWIAAAVKRGARVLAGGTRAGSVVRPTVLANAPADCDVNCSEVFGPVVTVTRYREFDEALAMVNDTHFGLQAGVFTNDLRLVWRAYEEIETGGVIHNDVPTFRVDAMPYGGIKDSGMGREGARWAIEEMTEPKLLVLKVG
ncbi:MAG: aldehyde dehydrogenase family protein [Candidatus Zixiibacteriota bacterium]